VISFLFRHRDRILAAWGLLAIAVFRPPRGWVPSLAFLLAGFSLRLWARAHIGPHSRGRNLSSPERCTGGPYRWIDHPLYVANLLVIAGVALEIAGPEPAALVILSGPVVLYALLGRAESRRMDASNPPERSTPLPWSERRMASEWASLVPSLLLWGLLAWWSR